VTEEQRRQASARALPEGLPIFAAAAALLVDQRSMKDILPSYALPRRQISGNAFVPYLQDGFNSALGVSVV
jgi:hypothetical protein